jgi:hypothetical protein
MSSIQLDGTHTPAKRGGIIPNLFVVQTTTRK